MPLRTPESKKAEKAVKRVKAVRSVAIVVRLLPEERDALRLNAGVHGLNMSDYIRQTCLGIHLRRTPEEKRRLRELARIGANINQLAKWANTHKHGAEAIEVITVLAEFERRLVRFASGKTDEDETEQSQCS